MRFISRLLGLDKREPGAAKQSRVDIGQEQRDVAHFTWQESAAHLLLLRHFLDGGQVKHLKDEQWRGVLHESPAEVVSRFLRDGVLVKATLAQSALTTLTATQAKDLARTLGVKVSGRKSEVIQRVLEASPEAVQQAVGQADVLICGTAATSAVQHYVVGASAAKEAMESSTWELVQAHRFAEAARCVGRYEAAQVFPRGIGVDWSQERATTVSQLEDIFAVRPSILKELDPEEVEPFRVGAAMMLLLGTNTAKRWLPPGMKGVERFDVDTAARMMLFRAQSKAISHKKGTLYRVFGAPDSCAACKAFAGQLFKPADVPEFPYEHCSHAMACRCLLTETSEDTEALSRGLGLQER